MFPDQEKRSRIWDKATTWIIAVAVLIGVVGGAWGVAVVHQTSGLTQTISKHNGQITVLLHEHSSDLATANKLAAENTRLLQDLTVVGKDESELAVWLIQSQEAVCSTTGAACPAIPILEGVSP